MQNDSVGSAIHGNSKYNRDWEGMSGMVVGFASHS